MKPKFRSRIAAFAPRPRRALLVCVSLCASLPAHAAKTWTGATDANWATAANWVELAIPGTGDTVTFDANSTTNLAINLGANRDVRGLLVGSPVGPVTLSNNSLILREVGINMGAATQDLTINPTVTFFSAVHNLNVAAGRTLTLANVPVRNTGANSDNVGAVVRISTTGTTKIGTTARAALLDGAQNLNPFITYGDSHWAATDATGTVVAATYTPWAASVGTAASATPADVTGTFTQSGNGSFDGIRFADAATAQVVTLTAATTFTGRGLLMVPGCLGGTITGGFLRPNRVSTAGASFAIIQNSTTGDLTVGSNLSNASGSPSTPVSVTKAGPGKLIAIAENSYTGRTFIHGGTLQLGAGGTTGSLGGTSSNVINNAALVVNRSNDLTLANAISGTGTLTKQGAGVLTLGNSNTYSGATTLSGGLIAIAGTGSFGNTTALTIDGAGVRWNAAADISTRPVTIGAAGATFDTNGNNVQLANTIGNSGTGGLTKTGGGTLTLAASNTYSGGTIVNGGKLLAAAAAATGSGPVAVNSGATLGGTGVPGAVSIASGASIAPGLGVGTLAVGGLSLAAGSTGQIEFSAGLGNDQITVATTDGLTLNGGALTLYQEGVTTPFSTPGTYTLISYTGVIGGTGVSALSVANPQPGFTYVFGESGGWVTLTIGTAGVVREWTNVGSGSWETAGNWSGSVPNISGATANFLTAAAGPVVVTLDGNRTVGALAFNNAANSYVISSGTGGTLTLDNGPNNAAIALIAGSHAIAAPLTLGSNTDLTSMATADHLTLSGVVSGAAGKAVTKTGPGALSLLAANDFAGPLSLSGGATTFANGGLGTGSLTLSEMSLVWATANTQDISDRTITFGTNPVVFDTNGNDVALANAIGNAGPAAFTKAGLGKLTLAADATFTGPTTISGGALQLGAGGATGLVTGAITNNAQLIANLADGAVLANLVSGTGAFVHAGSGSLTLGAATTFTGQTAIITPTASLVLGNSLSLQSSTLAYGATGGSLAFDTLTAATLGGLSGDRNLVLENTTPAAVVLTIGNNGTATSYAGILSGSGSLIKTGVGVTTLSGANSYSGATTVNGGTLELADAGIIASTTVAVTGNGTLYLSGAGSSLSASALCTVNNAGTAFPVLRIGDGLATLNGGLDALGNANNGYRIQADGGILTATNVRLDRGSLGFDTEAKAIGSTTQGLYVNGATVEISGVLEMGGVAGANSSVSTRVDYGSLTVAGKVTVGLNNGGRWSVLQVSGGTFTATDTTSGVVLGGPFAGNAMFDISGGTATVERVQFGQAELAGTSVTRISSGALYMGSGGFQKVSPNNASEIRLAGGTLGAKADWGTAMPINVTGTGNSTLKAADAADSPFNITLTGALTGTGGLIKQGGGTVTLGGGNSYAGSTTVTAGTLKVQTSTFVDVAAISIAAGASLDLDFTGGDRVGSLTLADTPMADGIYGSLTNTTPGIIQNAAITGPGLLYVNVAMSPYLAWAGDPANGLTAGVNDGPTQDPDHDGISNLMEYVLGGMPAGAGAADLSILPKQTLDATNLVLTFRRSDLSEGDTAVIVQWSTDLATWLDFATIGAADALPAVDVTEDLPSAALDTVVVTIPQTGHEAGGKLYGRVKATK
jgi:autotransporter-associated beta strand protein